MLIPLISFAFAHLFPSTVPKLQDAVVYEDNLRAEGPQVGFRAVTARLGSIQELGANVLWLMPVTPVGKLRSAGGLGSPYAFADFSAVNPEFGTADDLRQLIREAHRRKIAVVIDWVANHSSWDNPWITAHPEWYVHDQKGNIVWPPNTNWKDVAQLDYRKHSLWTAMTAAMQSWLDRFDLDGFRCDSAEFVPDAFWKDAVASLRKHTAKPLFMLAEGYRPSLCEDGFDLNYGWHFCDRLIQIVNGGSATGLAAAVREEEQAMPTGKLRLRFITNHDHYAWDGTPLERYKNIGAIKVALALEATYGGVPLIYSGQEVNWPNRIPIFEHTTIDWQSGKDMRAWIGQVMSLRSKHPVLREGSAKDLSVADVVILNREWGNEQALVIANVRNHPVNESLDLSLTGLWADGFLNRPLMVSDSFQLAPYEVKILFRKRQVSQTR